MSRFVRQRDLRRDKEDSRFEAHLSTQEQTQKKENGLYCKDENTFRKKDHKEAQGKREKAPGSAIEIPQRQVSGENRVKQRSRLNLPKDALLRKRSDFLRVYERGKRLTSKHLVLHYLKEGTESTGPRLGITVTKKCGNAVRRNRWKRLIREAYRLHRQEVPAVSFVVTVKRGVEIPSFQALEKEMERLWKRVARDMGLPGSQQ